MQRNFECLVCSDFFVHGTRIPKTLSCGHSFCTSCLKLLLKGTTINCPKCRTSCQVPKSEVDSLPTSYAVLEMLETMCAECRDRPHTQRCDHCAQNLCDVCRQQHMMTAKSRLTTDYKALEDLIAHLTNVVDDDLELQRITTKGEQLIKEMTKNHRTQVDLLQKQYDQDIAKINEQMMQDTEAYISWQENISKLLAESKSFLGRLKIKLRIKTATTHGKVEDKMEQECKQKLAKLRTIEMERPCTTDISVTYREDDFKTLLSKCVELKMSLGTSSEVSSTAVPKVINQVPDYSAASYKSTFKLNTNYPSVACTDFTTGNIIVGYSSGGKICILKESLELIQEMTVGTEKEQLKCLSGIFMNTNIIFFTDHFQHLLYMKNISSGDTCTIGSKAGSQEHFNFPSDVVMDSQQVLYVCDAVNKRIKVLSKDGTYIREFGNDIFENWPIYIAVSQNDKVVVSDLSHNLYLFTTMGQHIRTIKGKVAPHNIIAAGVVFDDHGNLIASDSKGRIVVMKETGDVVCFIGTPGEGPGQLKDPKGLTITKIGDIIVCDLGNKRIQKFCVPFNKSSNVSSVCCGHYEKSFINEDLL